MNTNWTEPKRNILPALNDFRIALASGNRARLILIKNEDCSYPIKVKRKDTDFRNYEFNGGTLQTRETIAVNENKSDFEKYLSLNYKTCYGTQEAMNRYYKKGLLSPDNFKGVGVSHLVRVNDMISFFTTTDDKERATNLYNQYFNDDKMNDRHFFDNFNTKNRNQWETKIFKHKVWAVELLDEKFKMPLMSKIFNALCYPLKFIPRRSTLKMRDYILYTFRIGSISNGYSIEFSIPKKFSF